ncbi:serine/threonine protein phosphatase 2A 55 kDa regulatory subunit B beta isoform [Trifolium repens]|nr:serine/threonine protein phosphatase 2A 55 kDa regulatory subunit B beta isoform [Trifolium repens]
MEIGKSMASYEEILMVKEAQQEVKSSSNNKNPPRRGGIRTLPFILDSMKLLIIAGFGGKLLDSSSYAQEERVKDAGLQLQFFYDNHICTLKLAQFPDVLYSYKPILEQLKFAEERVKDVDIQVISHETSLVARCRRVYAHAHDYHINSISNNRVNLAFVVFINQDINIILCSDSY